MIELDGSFGEGGGQILRTSLAMSLVTGKPFRITNIRAGRKKPGLLHQHLTSVNAAAKIGRAEVSGDDIGSQTLHFSPKTIEPGRYRFAVGTAGSCTLVLQTVLPALLTAAGDSELILEGGTHNPFAPPFDFLAKVYAPIVNRMGPAVSTTLDRPGFYPAGGGRFVVSIKPSTALSRIDFLERGKIKRQQARALVARLPRGIGDRELKVIRNRLGWDSDCLSVEEVADSRGPGNVLMIEVESEHVTELFTGFGQRGVPAEQVADQAANEVREYLASDVPVGKHLADQLLIPMVLAGGGTFRTLSPTPHTRTNIDALKRFLDVEVSANRIETSAWEIDIKTS